MPLANQAEVAVVALRALRPRRAGGKTRAEAESGILPRRYTRRGLVAARRVLPSLFDNAITRTPDEKEKASLRMPFS